MAENFVNFTGSSFQGNFVQGNNSGNMTASSSGASDHEESKAVAAEI
jgi:hypothetical protein